MALTLTEGAKLSNDILLQGVIEETIYDSPILQVLPFIEVVGNAWIRAFGCDGLPAWRAKGWSLATWSNALDTLLRLPEHRM